MPAVLLARTRQEGGAIYANGAFLTIISSMFIRNYATIRRGCNTQACTTPVRPTHHHQRGLALPPHMPSHTHAFVDTAITRVRTLPLLARQVGGALSVGGANWQSYDSALVLRSNAFIDNHAVQGCAMAVTPLVDYSASEIYNNTFRNGVVLCPGSVLDIKVRVPFRCGLGEYMPPTPFTVTAPVDVTGCQYACPSGTFGNSEQLTSPSCSVGDADAVPAVPSERFLNLISMTPADPLMVCMAALVRRGTYLEPNAVGTSPASCVPCVLQLELIWWSQSLRLRKLPACGAPMLRLGSRLRCERGRAAQPSIARPAWPQPRAERTDLSGDERLG
jgi:hypothetical protein